MRVDWVEPFSNHLQMKSCPGEGQTAWCIAPVHKALTGILDVLFWVEIIEFCFPFWQQTSGLYFERMLVLKPVKLCQSWSRDLRVCSAASFVSGLIVAREKILHLPTRSHNAYTLFLLMHLSVFMFSLSLPFSSTKLHPPHRPVVYNHLILPMRVWRCFPVLSLLLVSVPAGRVLRHAEKQVIWSLFAPKTFMCHCFRHAHEFWRLEKSDCSARLYFLCISFIGNCLWVYYPLVCFP